MSREDWRIVRHFHPDCSIWRSRSPSGQVSPTGILIKPCQEGVARLMVNQKSGRNKIFDSSESLCRLGTAMCLKKSHTIQQEESASIASTMEPIYRPTPMKTALLLHQRQRYNDDVFRLSFHFPLPGAEQRLVDFRKQVVQNVVIMLLLL
jgi:hypothetical protein